MSTNAKPYKDTLNLPVTRFEMKANLAAREPKIQARWRDDDLYGQIRKARAGREALDRGGGRWPTPRRGLPNPRRVDAQAPRKSGAPGDAARLDARAEPAPV